MLGAALIVGAITAHGFPQVLSTTPRPGAVRVKVQVVLTRGDGDKKVGSPYSLSSISSGETATLRIGAEVPVGTAFEQIGTQIDFSVTTTTDGRYQLQLDVKGRFLSPDGKPRDLAAQNTFTLRDGESTKYAGSDDSGAAFTLDVTLTAVK